MSDVATSSPPAVRSGVDYSKFENIDDPDDESFEDIARASKARGNERFAEKEYAKATEDYEEALDALKKWNDEKHAPERKNMKISLHSNRSMCFLKLGQFKKAVSCASEALKTDRDHVKSLYRRACAYEKMDKPKSALRDILALIDVDASNRVARKMKKKLIARMHPRTAEAVSDAYRQEKAEREKKARKIKRTTSSSRETKTKIEKVIVDDDEDLKDLTSCKGYKKTSDGRTTSYFHRELDETAKKLMGDCTPRRIDHAHSTSTSNKAGSAWNASGTTVEEADMTERAKKELRRALKAASADVEDAKVAVSEIKSLKGEASRVVMRGRARFLYEFSFDVVCRDEKSGETLGTLKFEDVTSDDDDASVSVSNASDERSRRVLLVFKKVLEKVIGSFVASLA